MTSTAKFWLGVAIVVIVVWLGYRVGVFAHTEPADRAPVTCTPDPLADPCP